MTKVKNHAAVLALIISLLTISPQTVRAESLWDGFVKLLDNFAVADSSAASAPTCTTNPVVVSNFDAGEGTLRQAVIDACPGSTITFSDSFRNPVIVEGELKTRILLEGQIRINKNLTIQGPGTYELSIVNHAGRGPNSRIFLIETGTTAAISGLTIAGGDVDSSGGGIFNSGNLTVTNLSIINNRAVTSGGGIFSNFGNLNVINSTIWNNTVNGNGKGGGLYLSNTDTVIKDTTISGNSGFSRVEGAGIFIVNRTLSIISSTIVNNSTRTTNGDLGFGGGINNQSGTVNIRNSILAGNTGLSSNDFYGTLTSQGYNLIGAGNPALGTITGDTTGNIVGTHQNPVNARLAPLGFYGGQTLTHALLSDSPAVNAGDPGISAPDQRGASRVGRPDIGAFEVNNSQNGGGFVAVVPDGLIENPYEFVLIHPYQKFGDPAPPYTYNMTGGTMPNGIALTVTPPMSIELLSGYESRNGFLSIKGLTTTSGNFNFSITATDNGYTNVTDYSLRILDLPAPGPCVVNPVVDRRFTAGAGSLGQALVNACPGSTITFSNNLRGTIVLKNKQLTIDKNLTIRGPGADKLTIQKEITLEGLFVRESSEHRMVKVNTGVTATISGLTISGANTEGSHLLDFRGIENNGTLTVIDSNTTNHKSGGGIINNGNLTVTNSSISNNLGSNTTGEGILSLGNLTVTNSIISQNQTNSGISSAGNLTVTNSTISKNGAFRGGGIKSRGTTAINNSTISENVAQAGGGLDLGGTTTITNTTVSSNRTLFPESGPNDGSGGGIYFSGSTLTIVNSTITNNSTRNPNGVAPGGGIARYAGTVNLRNTIVAENDGLSNFKDFIGTLNSQGYNLIGINGGTITGDTTGNIVGTSSSPVDPQTAPLGFYGGQTLTHALLSNSPAVNAGDPTVSTPDQRGAARVGRADIGAFELNNSANGGNFIAVLPDGIPSNPYDYALISERGATDFALTGGALPNGISLVTDGANVSIRGTTNLEGTFFFSVTATEGGNSNVTNYRVRFGVALTAPTVSAVCNGSVSSVNVSWSDAGRGSQGYFVDISATPDFSQVINKFVPSGTTSTTFGAEANLQGGTIYYVRVYYVATNEHSPSEIFRANNCSQPTPTPTPTATPTPTPTPTPTVTPTPTPTPLPTLTAPTVSPVCSGTVSSVNVSWSDAGRGAQGYFVDISPSPSFSPFFNKQIPAGTTTTTFGSEANLQAGTTYYVRVYYRATNEHSPSATFTAINCAPTPTPTPTATPTPTPTPLPALTAPTVSPNCTGTVSSVNVSWSDAGRGSQGYFVDISPSPNFNTYVNKQIPAGTTSTIFGAEANLQGGTTYYVRIYYVATNEHSPAANLTARTCAYSIAGTVNYGIAETGQTGAAIPNVQMAATGATSASAASNSSGIYQFNNLTPSGSYTITPSKTGDVRGINSLDATRIQQHLVGMTTLSANQLIAADTDGNGVVNSLDATRIQQSLIGMQTSNIIGQWKFTPVSRQYNSLNSNLSGEDYQAILVGEVSGNWASAASFAENSPNEAESLPESDDRSQTAERFVGDLFGQIAENANRSSESSIKESPTEMLGVGVRVSLPSDAMDGSGSTVTIPVTIGEIPPGDPPLESFDFSVFYDPAVLQPATPAGSNTGTLSANCSVLSNSPVAGRVIVSGACAQAITVGSGVLYNLTFNVIGSPGQITSLSFRNPSNNANTFQFNNGSPYTDPVNGQFLVLPVLAANASVSGRVLTPDGRGLMNAMVVMTDLNGGTRTARTNPFGFYRFEEVETGQVYVFRVSSKSYSFAQQVVTVMEDLTGLNFTPVE